MKLLDKYLFSLWGKAFFWSLLVLWLLITVGDFNDQLRKFPLGLFNGGELFVFFSYYLPAYLPKVLPMAFMMSIAYTIAYLNKNHELIGFRMARLSWSRLFTTLSLMTLTLIAVQWIMVNYVTPHYLEQIELFQEKMQVRMTKGHHARGKVVTNLAFVNEQEGRTLYLERWYPQEGRAEGIHGIDKDESFHKRWQVYARHGEYYPEQERWKLENGFEYLFDKDTEEVSSVNLFDVQWTEEISENPVMMSYANKQKLFLSVGQLKGITDFLAKTQHPSSEYYRLFYYKTLVSPLMLAVVFGITVPLLADPAKRRGYRAMLQLVGLIFLFWVVNRFLDVCGAYGWLPMPMTVALPYLFGFGIAFLLWRQLK